MPARVKHTPVIGDLVAVDWRDAHASVKAEMTVEEVAQVTSYVFKTYGILARDDRGRTDIPDPLVAVAAEVGEDGRYRGVTFVPVGMVLSVLRAQQPRRPRPQGRRQSSSASGSLPQTTPSGA